MIVLTVAVCLIGTNTCSTTDIEGIFRNFGDCDRDAKAFVDEHQQTLRALGYEFRNPHCRWIDEVPRR